MSRTRSFRCDFVHLATQERTSVAVDAHGAETAAERAAKSYMRPYDRVEVWEAADRVLMWSRDRVRRVMARHRYFE